MNLSTETSIWDSAFPWSEPQITASTFRDFQRTSKTIERLPGAAIHDALEGVQFTLSIFLDSVEDLIDSIGAFKAMVDWPSFWERTRRQEFRKLETMIQRGIFSSSMSAMALVDHTRAFSKQVVIDRYEEKKNEVFADDPQHGFVHSLRRYVTHVRMTKGNWHIHSNQEGKSIFFILGQQELLEWSDWSAPAREFIKLNPKGVNVESLFDSYARKVRGFHEWLRAEVWARAHAELHEYYWAKRVYSAASSRSYWNLLIQQVFEPRNIDPYTYLGRYLEPEEMEEILSLPFRSKEQVDRIVQLVDEHGACDEELRQHVYRLFKVH